MKASQFFKMYFSLQKSNTDPRYWQTLTDWLDQDISRKIREFSRGNMQKWEWRPALCALHHQ
jgi:hypothetical protein